MIKKIGIFIFRRDMRIYDNIGLNMLSKEVDVIIPIFILDQNQIQKTDKNKYYFSNNAVQFICESLIDLNDQLNKKNSKIYLFFGDPINIILKLIKNIKSITHIGFNLDFSNYAISRDNDIANICQDNNIQIVTCDNDYTLLDTNLNLNKDKPFKQFGAYFKQVKKHKPNFPDNKAPPNFINKTYKINFSLQLDKLNKLYNDNADLDQNGGREEAINKLKIIKDQKQYNLLHDRLDHETTHLSAYLNLGCLSIREVYHVIIKHLGKNNTLLKQLYWRDFYMTAMRFIDNATSYTHYIDPRFDKLTERLKPFLERGKKELMLLWKCQTGFLLIDAAMKQLTVTGYCHNRGRLLLGIFWTKYLLIDMLHPKYGSQVGFSSQLVDAIGTSQNKMNHHWLLDFDYPGRRFGKGISGRPLDISNINIKKYDPECAYIKKWLPELKDISNKDLYKWDKQSAETNGGVHPYPIFDSKERYHEWKKITEKL